MNYYIVFDGRARYDEDVAEILDTIGETTKKNAVKEFLEEWCDTDAVLFEYDIIDGNEDEIINGRRIFTEEDLL